MTRIGVAHRDQEFWNVSANAAKIGIVTALPKEAVAVLKALDEVGKTARNGVVYDIGLATGINGTHRVVHASSTGMGNTAAAVVGTRMLQQFPDLQHVILVGIAGIVPDPTDAQKHARLGDVVISSMKGVIEFDYKKEGDGWEEVRSAPTRPGPRLLDAVARLQRKEEDGTPPGERPWVTPIAVIAQSLRVTRPAEDTDVLHSAEEPFAPIAHPVEHERHHGIPRIHVASIASSGTLLKNPKRRDQLGQQFGVRAVEMEGAGVSEAAWADERGYLVIRGGCDYCDSFKNDDWQRYAAVVAAAYLSALLKELAAT